MPEYAGIAKLVQAKEAIQNGDFQTTEELMANVTTTNNPIPRNIAEKLKYGLQPQCPQQ